MVHEFGHNFGLGHNGDGDCKDNGFVMIASGQVKTFGWSPCSKKKFQITEQVSAIYLLLDCFY